MNVRAPKLTDIPILRAMQGGYPYPEFEGNGNWEGMRVVVDENDTPVAACGAERMVQLYLWMGKMNPAAKLYAMRLLHEAMIPALKEKGYHEANGFLPPELSSKFGRRLERSFGWVRNWTSWARHI